MDLILIGAVVADHLAEVGSGIGWRTVGAAAAARLGILPLGLLLLAKVFLVSVELKRVMVLEATRPLP